QGEAATFKQLGSNTTNTLAEAAKCWQTAAQHWKKHPQLMTPGKHLDTGTSCWVHHGGSSCVHGGETENFPPPDPPIKPCDLRIFTTTQHCTAALEGLQASMDGGQYKLCGDQRIPNQGEQRGRRGRGRTFILQDTDLCGAEKAVQCPALGFWEPVPIVQIPPPAWEVGGPEKASQKGELFESSVIQKRPFN
ncbi:hypothetical protein KUCAC02_017610, partial [Chaenocephalus aceratus]